MMYEKYAPTEIRWNSDYPKHWKCEKAKRFFSNPKIINRENTVDNVLSLTLRGVIRNNKERPIGLSPEDYSTYQIFKPDELVFKLIDLNNISTSRVGLVPETGIMSSAYIRFAPKCEMNVKYFYYQYYDWYKRNIFNGLGAGVRQTLSGNDLANLEILFPPRDEQDQIVRYLDWQVSKINKLISAKKKEILLLQEAKGNQINDLVWNGINPVSKKDSGIEYLGTVPSNWLVLLNHRLFTSVSRKFEGQETVLSLSQKDGLIPYKDMTERSLHTSSYDNWQLVIPNDLVLNRFKAHLGVFFASNYRGIATFHYGVYKARMPLCAKYYECLYHTPVFRRVYAGQSRGMTVGLQNLSDTNFYSTYTIYPPYDEQLEIVARIEKIETDFSKIIKTIDEEITVLHNMRTKLISDVVTGQIDVRNIEIPDYEYVEEETEETEDDIDEENEEQEVDE